MFCVGIWDISATTNCKEVEYETHIAAHYRLRHALRPQRLRQPGQRLFTRGRYSNILPVLIAGCGLVHMPAACTLSA